MPGKDLMNEKYYDIGIIGAGPAGYTAALCARKNGQTVIMFEKNEVGGVCLNRGCIPTKTVLHSAELYEDLKCAESLGITAENVTFDFEKVMARKDETTAKLKKSLELTLKNSGVVTIKAEARAIDAHTICADGEKYTCKKIIIAIGSEPKTVKGLEFDHKFILNSDDILNLKTLPKSILIAGSGAIGVEWARIFAAFGTDVTVVELADRLLPLADIEVSKRLERIFKSKKIKYFTSTSIEGINYSQGEDSITVTLSNSETLEPQIILAALGRKPREIEKIDGIEYIGDICGSIQLAHFAIKQALACVSEIPFDETLIPTVVYGNPEIAWVGKREQDLEEGTYKKSNLLISALGKSHCDNCIDGFIKILSTDDKIVGAHIVSKEASALIQQILIAMQNNITPNKLKEVCFAHPTYSEGIFECLRRL